jgi:SOS response regulatory protein OraA/RecX
MHTVHEIRAGLQKRGFGQDVIENLLTQFIELKYLDDDQFAQSWISSRSAGRLHGRFRLARDLKQKGVSETIISEAMERSLTVEDELIYARKAAEKKVRTLIATGIATGKITGKASGGATRLKARASLYRHLSSRGFTADVVRATLNDVDIKETLRDIEEKPS